MRGRGGPLSGRETQVGLFPMESKHSFLSDVSRFFAGAPTDKSVWTLVAGALIAILGLSAPPAERPAGSCEDGTETTR